MLRRTLTHLKNSSNSYNLVVVGGGTGGLAISAHFSRKLGPNKVAVIEPSLDHYYQPLWTFVGGGLKQFEASRQPTAKVMPPNATWIQDAVIRVEPENNKLFTKLGNTISYDYLVLAPGFHINWKAIKGLPERIGKNGVCSNYSPIYVHKTREFLDRFSGGHAIFSTPSTPFKCPGAAQKIAYLAEEQFRQRGIRDRSRLTYFTPNPAIFAVEKYAKALRKVCEERNIQVKYKKDLVEIRNSRATPGGQVAIFRDTITGDDEVVPFDFLHVTPPMVPPKFIKESGLGNNDGFADVDQLSLQHVSYKNIFAIGDASSLPTSKTAAAVAAQSGVLTKNLTQVMEGKLPECGYDGYTSCPLITGKNKLILAEFSGYTGQPMETFPFDQGKERRSMYMLTEQIMPRLYWDYLLSGEWKGPEVFRQISNLVKA